MTLNKNKIEKQFIFTLNPNKLRTRTEYVEIYVLNFIDLKIIQYIFDLKWRYFYYFAIEIEQFHYYKILEQVEQLIALFSISFVN